MDFMELFSQKRILNVWKSLVFHSTTFANGHNIHLFDPDKNASEL